MQTKLKQIRELSGKTQSTVAHDLGVSLSTYRSWEQGQRNLNGKKLDMLADYFHVSTDTILGTKHGEDMGVVALSFKQTMTPLLPDELNLVELYRRMTSEDKKVFLSNAKVFAIAGDAKKESISRNENLARHTVMAEQQ